ncbi:MAG: HD domain-containing protein [Betaproteobacteria bacterium]
MNAGQSEIGGHQPPTFAELTPENIVAFLADIFARRGAEEYLGEPVTMAEHMLQAAQCAQDAGQSSAVIVAALLHDIGHFTSEFGTYSPDDVVGKHHEDAGAAVLAPFFPPQVTDCVRFHVAAKRYLCATRPEYFQKLSTASVHTLMLQGGPMGSSEAAAFERNAHWRDVIKVRVYDDTGKRSGVPTKTFVDYMPMVQQVVDAHRQERAQAELGA